MKNFCITLLLSFFSLYTFSASQSRHEIQRAISSVSPELNQKDINLANNFKLLYKLVSKGKINKKLLTRFDKSLKKSDLFKSYRFWPKSIVKLSELKSVGKVHQQCNKSFLKSSSSFLEKKLYKNITNYCLKRYFELLGNYELKDISKHKTHLKFVNQYYHYIHTNLDTDDVISFFNHLSSSKKIKRAYSKKVLNYFRVTDVTPDISLIRSLNLSAADMKYLQEKDLSPLNTSYVFYNELKKFKEKAFDLVDKGEEREAKTAFDELMNYYQKTKTLLPQNKAFLTLLSISKSFMRRGHFEHARKGLSEILVKDNSEYQDALFEYLWSYVLDNHQKKGLAFVTEKVKNKSIAENLDPRVLFWMSYLQYENGQKTKSIKNFEKIIQKYPLSFYAILSAKVLGESKGISSNQIFLEELKANRPKKVNISKVDKTLIKRSLLWAKVYHPAFLNAEIDELENIQDSQSRQTNLISLANSLKENQLYLESFKVLYKSIHRKYIALDDLTINILFPKPYFNQIEKNSKNFDPIIALSLIRQESGFNKRARSHVGARGLMQLMPSTARQFRKRLKKRHLYNPNLNIKIGTSYFKNLLKHYDNNLVYSLAAYNAGERRVNEWQEEYLTSDSILENIENIPFNETKKYVKLIFRNMFFYKLLTPNQAQDTAKLNEIYDIHLGFEG